MVSGEKGLMGFHRKAQLKAVGEGDHIVPKGCLAVKVGQDETEQQRFVVPVMYLKHPLFVQLLKVAEEEYGFEQKGAIKIPCHVAEFRYVRGLIDKDVNYQCNHNHHGRHGLVGCFRV